MSVHVSTNGVVSIRGNSQVIQIDNVGGDIRINGVSVQMEAGQVALTVNIDGDCHSVTTRSGDINVNGMVDGSVTTSSGDVTVYEGVHGNVTTSSGDVDVNGEVAGHVNTSSGDIRYRK